MNRVQTFPTHDIYQTAFLELSGFPSTLLMETQQVVFNFELSVQLVHAIAAYNAGMPVSAKAFARVIKLLKSRVEAIKREYEGSI